MKSLGKFFAVLLTVMLFISHEIKAQDLNYVRQVIETLCSTPFQGRGYVNGGDKRAADYLVQELGTTQAKMVDTSYYQYFNIDINTFPTAVSLQLNDKLLQPGVDFTLGSYSPTVKGSFKTLWLHANSLEDPAALETFMKTNLKNTVLILDTGFKETDLDKIYTAKGLIVAQKNPPIFDLSEGMNVMPYFSAYVSREKIPEPCELVRVNIESFYRKDYRTQNVVAMIKGSQQPDSFLVYTAHYDHLGRLGADTYFPGAHDNASGCAMLLDLAKYYSNEKNAPEYSVVFMFFSAEETGLKGSKYFVDHPLIPLSNIRFLLNLDMVSTGSEGIKVVNGAVLKKQFEQLTLINAQDTLLKLVSPRGEAQNSDHYWFSKKGVPSFFIYTLGNEWKEYHTILDRPKGLPMTEYEDLFKLVTRFMKAQ